MFCSAEPNAQHSRGAQHSTSTTLDRQLGTYTFPSPGAHTGALLALNDLPFVRFSSTLATSRDVRFASCTRGGDTAGYE